MAPARRTSCADCLAVAVAFALAAGLAEVLVHGIRSLVFGDFTWTGIQVTWMAPTAYLLAFLPPSLVVASLAWRWPSQRWAALLGAGFAGVATVALVRLLSQQRLWLLALVFLAAGIAIQVGRALLRERVMARARIAVPVLAAVAILLTGSVQGWIAWRDRPQGENRQPRAGAPNVLLLILDTVRASSLSLYHHPRPTTPRLAGWAERGVVFDAAIAPSSWTLPSHASMFTGRNPHELGVDWLAPLGPSAPTLAEVLRREGYRTGGFVANLLYTTRESGLARGFDVYREHPVTLKHILMSTELGQLLRYPRRRAGMIRNYPRKPAEVVNREFLEWLGEPRADRPFFAFLNYFDAHVPYHAPDSLRGAFRSGNWSLDMYETAIAYLDGEMDALLRELERRGVLDETVVIITSDHGEQFGAAHGLGGHGNSLYMQLVHVPLVMIHPGLPGGLRIEGPVALRDLAATVLDLADVSDGTLLPGLSLARLWSEEGAVGPVEPVLSTVTPTFRPKPVERNARGELRSLVLERFHYILNPDGTEELFDFREDPREERNLVARDEGSATELSEPAELAELRRRMREIDMQHPRKTPGSEGGKNRM